MKPALITTQEPLNIDDTVDLNDRVLEAAALADNDLIAPESTPDNVTLSAWDESPGATGHRAAVEPPENEETISEQLVEAGSDEAADEQRLSADLSELARDAG